jgi:hypothetical protein
MEFEPENWRRRPDLNRGWRFCRPLPYHLATAPIGISRGASVAGRNSEVRLPSRSHAGAVGAIFVAKAGAGNGIRTRDFDLGKVALYH